MRSAIAAIAVFGVAVAPAAWAEVARAARYLPVHLSAENHTGAPLECQAVAGHWYSFDLGMTAVSARMSTEMVVDPATGTVAMLNSARDPVPIETVFCGVAGQAWDSRFVFPLRRIAERAAAGEASQFVCAVEGDHVTCR